MGYRLHVVKKQEKMSNYEALNYKEEAFKGLLSDLNIEVCSDMGTEAMSRFELLREEVLAGAKTLEELSKRKKISNEDIDESEVKASLESCKCTASEMLNIFNTILEESDKNSEYIIIWWY